MTFRELIRHSAARRRTSKRLLPLRSRPRSFCPVIETLENRTLLSTFTVDRLTDFGQGQGQAGDLRYCIVNAMSGDSIAFGVTGTITLTRALPELTSSISIQGPGASLVTISGNNSFRVFDILPGATVSLVGLTIANGQVKVSSDSSDVSVFGGGIFNAGTLTMSNCVVSGNVAEADLNNNSHHFLFGNSYGGGLFNSGTASVVQCSFSSNAATFDDVQTPATNSFDVPSAYGGAIDNVGVLTLAGSILNDNGGSYGGALYNSGQATVNDSLFSQNGVGIAPTGSGYFPAYSYGGAIDNDQGVLSLNNCTIAKNVDEITFTTSGATGLGVTYGGGIYSLGELSITSCTITGNSVSTTAQGAVTTIVQGGGVYVDPSSPDPARLLNTIISGNTSTMLGPDGFGTFASLGHNLIGKTDGSSGWVVSDMTGTAAIPLGPRLGPLQDNGGPTQTMALLSGSPALDTGDPSLAGTPDQRGVPRTGGVNIGAYQVSATTFLLSGFPLQVAAGVSGNLVTVIAADPYGQIALGYTGTVHFSSTDSQASLPPDSNLTNGSGTFGAILYTADTQSITATDTVAASITGTEPGIVVAPAPASQFQISAPSTAVSGMPFDVIVTALDLYGNIATNYQGTVTFSSSDTDPGVVLPPAPYTFTTGSGGDNGVHDFVAGVTLITPGNQTITATDMANSTITGNTVVTVSAPPSPPPGGGATGTRTPITNGVGHPAQQVVLLDRLFSLLSVKNPPLVFTRPEHKGLADDPLGDDEELLGSTGAGRLGVIPLPIK